MQGGGAQRGRYRLGRGQLPAPDGHHRVAGAGQRGGQLGRHAAGPWLAALTHWFTGLLAGFFLLLPLYLLRGMAAGDVKLMAMVGAFLGPQAALHVALLTYLFGAPLALATLLWHGWRQGDGLATAHRLGRNLWRLVQPWLGRLAGLPLAPLPREAIASVGGMPYGVAIALATAAVVAWPHR